MRLIRLAVAIAISVFTGAAPVDAEKFAMQTTNDKTITYQNPVYAGYFADPAVCKFNGVYYAYGTGDCKDGREFMVLRSHDLVHWESLGGSLIKLDDPKKVAYWAPEVAERDGRYFMYYSSGGNAGEGHQVRVAVAEQPEGPFKDAGKVLLPDEPFSIDAHPFRDPKSGKWYLFFAKDFFDGRAGTGTAVVELGDDMMSVKGPAHTVVRASADWQIFERNRKWYGKTWEAWHTVEGPYVVYHDGKYFLLYSGGRWEGPNYGLGYAVSDNVTGPYRDIDNANGPSVLHGTATLNGPGHNSVVEGPDGKTLFVVYHAWDPQYTARRMCIDPLIWVDGKPRCDGPSSDPKTISLK